MKITRQFTTNGTDPFDTVAWVKRASRISNPDGSVVFEMEDAEVPETWSQLATDIMVSKYFRKAGVPQASPEGGVSKGPGDSSGLRTGETPVPLENTPAPQGRRESESLSPSPSPSGRGGETGPEKSARQVIHRLAGCWRHWGEKHGYFDSAEDAQAFEDEVAYMMVHQMAAPNSPQWFNTGLNWKYGISGPAQGHFIADAATGEVRPAPDAYTHPQPHACFIQAVSDDLVNDGGIMDLWTREARLFKYGSGTGTNFSALRAENEPLSGGGKSSGLMSWLKIGDRAAGAIKSGGTTRRAAKMVCLDLDHPDVEQFINWKVREELKVAAMVEGTRRFPAEHREAAERLGLRLEYDFNGEAYQTVSGQNSNNSVRIPDEFFDALDAGEAWALRDRTSGEVARTVDADDLWEQVGFAAWRCADPGVQFDSTINAWHTCPESGRINASNPCSEYMFLDNTACNLASINLLKFYDDQTRTFDVRAFEHAVDLWTIVLEISVLMAAFPSEEIARLSHHFRTLGLGYANLGALLMRAGIPYDSDEARALCGAITATLTGRSYRQSALLAARLGPFPGYWKNARHMLRVIRNHRRAAHGVARDEMGDDAYENLRIAPVPVDHDVIRSGRVNIANAADLLDRAATAWDEALSLGERHGYRNAQVSVIAPTGTIGLLMDCDTTGVEPDFALVKFKKLAGGGYFKIANASLAPALRAQGYTDAQVRDILRYVLGTLSLDAPMPDPEGGAGDGSVTFDEFLKEKGLRSADLERVEAALPSVFELGFAFNARTLGDEALDRLGLDPVKAKADQSFSVLRAIGLTRKQIDALNEVICGTQTVEGAPHLRQEHLRIFDCASTCGKKGTRYIAPEGHIRMMAAAQPFISGAISKTINLPKSATVEDIKNAYRLSWELGLKANALYRDGSKLSQPLSNKSDVEEEADEETRIEIPEAEPADAVGAGEGAERGEPRPPARFSEATPAETAETAVADETAAAARIKDVGLEVEPAPKANSGGEDVRIVHRPMRRRLPDTRQSITHKFNVAGHEGYLTVGLYEDGRPGEVFITMAKEGSTIGGVMDSLGTAVSVALQYGVPIESLVNKFTHQRFEPAGMTTNRDIPFAKSLVDYIFRWLGMQFIPGYRAANAPKRGGTSEGNGNGAEAEASSSEKSGGARNGNGNGNGAGGARSHGGAASPPPATQSAPTPAAETAVIERRAPQRGPGAASAAVVIASSSRTFRQETTVVEASGEGGAEGRSVLSSAMRDCQGDAPACEVCGEITIRNGSCYRCLNCGHSMGCS